MKINQRRCLAAWAAVLLAARILLPAGASAAETVKVGISKILAYGNVPIAKAKGYFAAEGLDVELVFFDSAQPVAVAVASGDVQFGMAAATAGLYSLGGQGVLKIIAGSNREAPGFHSLAFLASNHAWDGGLRTLKDLPGHSVAITQIGTPLQYGLAKVLEKYGSDLHSIRLLPLQSNTNVNAALTSGQADAATFPVTPATPLIARGDVKLLGWLGDAVPWLPGSLLFTATKVANERHDTVERFLVAYRHAARDYHDTFVGPGGEPREGPMAPELLAILAEFGGITVAQAKLGIPCMDEGARIDEDGMLAAIAWYKSQNLLKGEIDGESMIDRRYATFLPKS